MIKVRLFYVYTRVLAPKMLQLNQVVSQIAQLHTISTTCSIDLAASLDAGVGNLQVHTRARECAISGPMPSRAGGPGRRTDWKCSVIDSQRGAGQPLCLSGLKDIVDSGRYTVRTRDRLHQCQV